MKKLLLVVLSTALALLAAEGILRAFFAERVLLFPRYHVAQEIGDFTVRRLRANTTFRHTSVDGTWEFVTNAQGFRNRRDFSFDKPDSVYRVVVLGDSHTQGFESHQDDTYAAVLEAELRRAGRAAEVYNLGVSGFGTAEQLVLLENEAIRYRPDVVVLGFFANDFEDNLKADLFTMKRGVLEINQHVHAPGVSVLKRHNRVAALRWLSEHSYFYSLFLNAAWEAAKDVLQARSAANLPTEFAVATQKVDAYRAALVVALLERMHDVCRSHGAAFLVVDLPQLTEDGRVADSLPAGLAAAVAERCDVIIRGRSLPGCGDASRAFVPHGQRHLSRSTHAAVAQGLADILTDRPR